MIEIYFNILKSNMKNIQEIVSEYARNLESSNP